MTAELEGELADPNERAVLRDAHEVQPLNDLGSVREVPAHREEKIRRELAVGIDDHVGVDARSFRVELVDEPVQGRALSAPVGIVSLVDHRAVAVGDRRGGVGAVVSNDVDSETVGRVLEAHQIRDSSADRLLLVVRRHQHGKDGDVSSGGGPRHGAPWEKGHHGEKTQIQRGQRHEQADRGGGECPFGRHVYGPAAGGAATFIVTRALAVRLALAVSVTVTLSLGGVTRVTEKLWAPPSPAVKVELGGSVESRSLLVDWSVGGLSGATLPERLLAVRGA